MTDEIKNRIIALRSQGMGHIKIARELNISENTVKSFLQRGERKSQCLCCGKPITMTPHKKVKKFCSDKCRMEWWGRNRNKRQGKAFYQYTCPVCGKVFTVYADKKRVYCSRECYFTARRKTNGED